MGASLVAPVLAACQPAQVDEGWSIWQLVVDDARAQVVPELGVSIADDGGSLVYANDRDALGDPPFTVLDKGARAVAVRLLAMPPNVSSAAFDELQVSAPRVSGDGLHVVGAVRMHYEENGPPVPQEVAASAGGGSPVCDEHHSITEYQVYRWSRLSRSSAFAAPVLVSQDAAMTAACVPEMGEPDEDWLGIYGHGSSRMPSVSTNGQSVAFLTAAENFGADAEASVAVRDGSGEVVLVTPASWTYPVSEAQISADGLHIAFVTDQSGVVGGTVGSGPQVYVASRSAVGGAWTFELVSRDAAGAAPSVAEGGNRGVSISANGARVAWQSSWAGFEPDLDLYEPGSSALVVRDRQVGVTRVARARLDQDSAYPVTHPPTLSGDGKRIAMLADTETGAVRDARVLLVDVDRVLSATTSVRQTGVIAARVISGQPGYHERVGVAGAGASYVIALGAEEAPLARYQGSPPSVYLVGGRGFGAHVSRQWHGDPVDVSIGSFAHRETDPLGAGVAQLDLTRSYNSVSEEVGGFFGVGWSTVFDASLEFDEVDGGVRVRTGDGRRLTFWPGSVAGSFTTGAGTRAVLSQGLSGYRLVEPSGRVLRFDEVGRLVGVEAPGVPAVSVSHPGPLDEPRETLVEFGEGDRWLRLIDESLLVGGVPEVGSDGLVDRVVSSEGVVVDYGYSQDQPGGLSLLSWVSRPYVVGGEAGFGRRFEWDGGRIGRIVDELAVGREHVVVDNSYDELGRVIAQVTDTGDVLEFHHGVRWVNGAWVAAPDYTTVVNEASGDRVAYRYGPGGEALGVTDPFGLSTASEWQGDQSSSATSRSGVKVSTAFDAAKRPVTVTETVGGASRTIASFAYVVGDTVAGAGSDQRLASRSDAAGVTTWFGYDEVASNSATLPHTVAVACDAASLDVGLTCAASGRSVTTFVYGTGVLADLVVSVTDADGVVTVFDYWADRTLKSVSTFPDAETTLVTSHEVVRRGDTGFDESNRPQRGCRW